MPYKNKEDAEKYYQEYYLKKFGHYPKKLVRKTKEEKLKVRREWYRKNIEKCRAGLKKSRLKHIDKRNAETRLWAEKNKEWINNHRKENYTGIYGSWYAMKQRCSNSKSQAYHNYGGRGIKYDSKWETIEGFKSDMEESFKKGLTLDRIDNNGNYCKENCRWATRKEQCNNMRKNILIEYNGDKKSLAEWAQSSKLNFGTFRSRYYRGISLGDIFKDSLYRPAKLIRK